MALFGRKKTGTSKEVPASPKPQINQEELEQKSGELVGKLENLSGQERVPVLNELGGIAFQLEKLDEAIAFYEESLDLSHSMGPAYTDLLKIYNKKRREAAEAGDGDGIKYYMDKIDGIMKLSKDFIRGRA